MPKTSPNLPIKVWRVEGGKRRKKGVRKKREGRKRETDRGKKKGKKDLR